MQIYNKKTKLVDINNSEVKKWLYSVKNIINNYGSSRLNLLINKLIEKSHNLGINISISLNTKYINTIEKENLFYPGNIKLESKILSYIRWNAMIMIVRANKNNQIDGGNLGGHISSFASIASMIECGYNHFWRSKSNIHCGDLIYFQGHSSPGIYSRSYLEGRLNENHLDNFRQEIDGHGLSSYPHPKLMPNFWQFPTVSMGIGPIMSIYQAKFLKYIENRNISNMVDRKVWVFCGDGEMDEPESLGSINIASREKLDNLIFVVNCNLQRLDGPVRGNNKIIQELEKCFLGNDWNVIKLIWGTNWDLLFSKDEKNILKDVMEKTIDGEYQNYKANDGSYVRKHFFGKHPELLNMVKNMNDEDIWLLNRGGHDPYKIFSAFKLAMKCNGKPTVILAKSIKGYGMEKYSQSKNFTHQQKKLNISNIIDFKNRFSINIENSKLKNLPYFKPSKNSIEIKYMNIMRKKLGGYLPNRRIKSTENINIENLLNLNNNLNENLKNRKISTTNAFVRILLIILRDKKIKSRIVPILSDESRTFGMEGLFNQIGIYNPHGQKYIPFDKNQLMYYKELINGQLLQEGINEAGAMSSWISAATSYSTNNIIMIPFFIYYSMFGFQRIGDLIWAAGDMQSRGFLIGGTSGRTTLNGEGLQHEDGHSHIQAATIPNCISYDPTFYHEIKIILKDGLKRIIKNQENIFYYLTINNENYNHPNLKKYDELGILKGMYIIKKVHKKILQIQLMGSGSILNEVLKSQYLLYIEWGISSNVWSITSFNLLRREGLDVERTNMIKQNNNKPYLTKQLNNTVGPIIAVTDYMKIFADQIRQFIPKNRKFKVLGTDGYGRSDFRSKLRNHFEINYCFIILSVLKVLFNDGKIKNRLHNILNKYNIDTIKSNQNYV